MEYTSSPDYLKAADLHNLGAGTKSFFDAPIDNTVDFVSKIPSFAMTSVASGINSIYNSGVVVGNILGLTDAKENDLQTMLREYDSDLGKYYSEHKSAVDLTGFIATSLIPGIAGVKALNYGQKALSGALRTGAVGDTLVSGVGLVKTATSTGETLAGIAGKALAESGQAFSFLNSGVIKSISAGVGQSALEGVAFEAMVNATMFRSPILEEHTLKDFASSIVTAGVLGGVIGGALEAAKTYKIVNKVLTEADIAQRPHVARESTGLVSAPSDKIILAAQDKISTFATTNSAEAALSTKRTQSIHNDIRSESQNLAHNVDPALGNIFGDTLISMNPQDISKVVLGAKSISRPSIDMSLELSKSTTPAIVRLHGEGAGDVFMEGFNKSSLTLADKFSSVREIDTHVGSYGYNINRLWNPLEAKSMGAVESRYIWASKQAEPVDGMLVHELDIPLLEKVISSKIDNVTVVGRDGSKASMSVSQLKEDIYIHKVNLTNELETRGVAGWKIEPTERDLLNLDNLTSEGKLTSSEIARFSNVEVRALESQSMDDGASMFARQDAQKKFNARRKEAGLSEDVDLDYTPKHVRIVYNTATLEKFNPDHVSAMLHVEQRRVMAAEAIDKAVAGVAGELNELIERPASAIVAGANRGGAGAGIITFANGSYGSLASWAEKAGKVTTQLVEKLNKNTTAHIESPALALRGNQAAAIEFSAFNDLASSTIEKYVLNKEGTGMVLSKVQSYKDAVAKGKSATYPELQEGVKVEYIFKNKSALDAVFARLQTNGERVTHHNNLQSAQGISNSKDASAYYPIRESSSSKPFFAFVKDESITGAAAGHTSMLHAASESELKELIKSVQERTKYKVYTKNDTREFFEAQRAYDFDRTLHDNYIDSSLRSKGINTPTFPKTDENKIVDLWMDTERRADSVLARETMSTKFAHEFQQLETLGASFTDIASSRYGVTAKAVESTTKNPYNDYRKTALNISRIDEIPLLSNINRTLETAVSGIYDKIATTFSTAASKVDLENVNKLLSDAGVNHAYKNAAEVLLANHTAPAPVLSSFIRGANAILANTFLRLDPMNALNNAIGSQVLLGHETRLLLKDIRKANPQLVGEMAEIGVPGTSLNMLSPAKLIGTAQLNFFKHLNNSAPELTEFYTKNRFLTPATEQFKAMLDDLSVYGAESGAVLDSKLMAALGKAKKLAEKVGEVGGKVTGNNLAEDYNRFIAADVARQITDVGVKSGVLMREAQPEWINTFVNRTQGNVLASQRPLIFQGPLGQAVGLFQGFQFNTMQQLFRGISEGGAKDAALLLGLQGTMYGLNGLPGFQYINQHIIGTHSANKDHTDAYTSIYGAAGKTAGDWLMYGIPSNILQSNLYTRGDINPRNITILPVNPADIVAISAFSKFAGNFAETVGKMAGGGDIVQSFIQGLEHNTLSRPLAGLAQTLQATKNPQSKVFSTTNAGDVSFVNDLFSLATLSRLAGAKPLDEALANDFLARQVVYKASDKQRMRSVTEQFKTNVIGDPTGTVAPQAVENYMAAFVHRGGRAEDFNKTMLHALTQVNTPRANQVMNSLRNSPNVEQLKILMNGKVADLE